MPMTNPRATATMPTDRAMTPLSAQLFGDELLSGSIVSIYICVEQEFNFTW
jgi:hypothetical protein